MEAAKTVKVAKGVEGFPGPYPDVKEAVLPIVNNAQKIRKIFAKKWI